MNKHRYSICIFLIFICAASCKNNQNKGNRNIIINEYQDSVIANKKLNSPNFLDSNQIERLQILCSIWGFLKYYHPLVRKGKYNWDKELLHQIPLVIQASSMKDVNKLLIQWIDELSPEDSIKYFDKATLPTSECKLRPNYGGIFENKNISGELKNKLSRFKEMPFSNTVAFYVKPGPTGAPIFTNEPTDYNVANASVRLLALFRYWNCIEYFYPYRYLIATWPQKLKEYIPLFAGARTKAKYTMTFLKLMATINDSHANIWGNNLTLDTLRGIFLTPFKATFIENKLVVTDYYKDTLRIKRKIHIGDIIESIDGHPVDSLIAKYLPLSPGSNYNDKLALLVNPIFGWLLRSNKKISNISLKRHNSLINERIKLIHYDFSFLATFNLKNGDQDKIKIFKDSIGYINAGNLKDDDFDSVYSSLKNTKHLIIDLRKYPGTFMPYLYAKWLKKESTPFAKTSTSYYKLPGYFFLQPPLMNGGSEFDINKKTKDIYTGKIIILVNNFTVSQGEFTAMAFRSIPNSIIIGGQTAGADGDVASIPLPGDINTLISSIGIYYPDGTETQRVGIKVDSTFYPTIKGIRDRTDELLQKAIEIATKS